MKIFSTILTIFKHIFKWPLIYRQVWYSDKWIISLQKEKQQLIEFVCEIENEFLENGKRLQNIHRELSEIRNLAAELSKLTDNSFNRYGNFYAVCLLRKIGDLADAHQFQCNRILSDFKNIHSTFQKMKKRCQLLARLFVPMRNIAVLFRIESAHYPAVVGSVFKELGEKIHHRLKLLEEAIEGQISEIENCCRNLNEMGGKVRHTINEHSLTIKEAIKRVNFDFKDFETSLANSRDNIANLTDINSSIEQHISGIIVAQQCQDAARQKAEHIGIVLDEIAKHMKEANKILPNKIASLGKYVAHASEMQVEQIETMFGELRNAARSISSHISALHTDLNDATKAATETSEKALKSDMAALCQKNINYVIENIQDIHQAFIDVQCNAQKSLNDTTSFTNLTAFDVRFDAINAEIFAARVDGGATLMKLAEETRSTANEIIDCIEEITHDLEAINWQLNVLSIALEDISLMTEIDRKMLIEELEKYMLHIREISSALSPIISRIQEKQEELEKTALEMIAGIRFPDYIQKKEEKALACFGQIIELGYEMGFFAEKMLIAKKLDELKQHYTVQSEYHIHENFIQRVLDSEGATIMRSKSTNGRSEPEATPSLTSSTTEEKEKLPINNASSKETFGDNVELF